MKSTRNTIQKQIIYSAVCGLFHPTADEVYGYISDEYPHISRATVFRVLNGLAESGRLKHIHIPNGADRFDATLSEHCHIRCVMCNRIDDVNAAAEVTGSFGGYSDVRCNVLFEGLCQQCAGKRT